MDSLSLFSSMLLPKYFVDFREVKMSICTHGIILCIFTLSLFSSLSLSLSQFSSLSLSFSLFKPLFAFYGQIVFVLLRQTLIFAFVSKLHVCPKTVIQQSSRILIKLKKYILKFEADVKNVCFPVLDSAEIFQ